MKTSKVKSAILLYFVGMVMIHAALFWKLRSEVRNGYSDFAIFYSAGKIVREGLGSHLYDTDLQFHIQRQFAPQVRTRQGALPYNHPPFEAVVFVPLAGIPYFAAYLLWDCANLLMLCALPLVLRPHVPLLRGMPAWCCLLGALAYFPIFVALLQGQDVIVLLLLLALVYAALKKNAEFSAGCWLALGLFRFHLVLPLVLILCLQRRRKAILGMISVALALGLISIAVVGWRGVWAYPGYVLRLEAIGGHGSIVPADMPNLRGLVDTLMGGRTSQTICGGLVAICSFMLFFRTCVKYKLKTAVSSPAFDLIFSLIVVVSVLVSYHALAYDLSLLLLPVLLIVNYVGTRQDDLPRKPLALLAPVMVLFFSPFLMLLSFGSRQLNLLALVLLAWVWGISREISRQTQSPA